MKLLWTDLETGGLDAARHDIIEVACIVEIDGQVQDELHMLMCPAFAANVDPKALQVQGRTLEQVMAHPIGRREGWRRWKEFLTKHVNPYERSDKFYWAGQNAPFDLGFGRALWKGNGDTYFHSFFHPFAIDLGAAMAMMRERGHFPNLMDHKLGTICEAVGVKLDRAHSALADIRATREAYRKLVELIPEVVAR